MIRRKWKKSWKLFQFQFEGRIVKTAAKEEVGDEQTIKKYEISINVINNDF